MLTSTTSTTRTSPQRVHWFRSRSTCVSRRLQLKLPAHMSYPNNLNNLNNLSLTLRRGVLEEKARATKTTEREGGREVYQQRRD